MKTYNAIADAYSRLAGEPLVADWNWIEPLWKTCLVAVECDPNLTDDEIIPELAVKRTAEVIYCITHGGNELANRVMGF